MPRTSRYRAASACGSPVRSRSAIASSRSANRVSAEEPTRKMLAKPVPFDGRNRPSLPRSASRQLRRSLRLRYLLQGLINQIRIRLLDSEALQLGRDLAAVVGGV